MQPIACLYTLFDSVEAAEHVARTLLVERVVACANIHAPCRSLYHWDGQLAEEGEVPVLFKLTTNGVELAVERLRQVHPYDTPAIVTWSAQTTPDYAAWLSGDTPA